MKHFKFTKLTAIFLAILMVLVLAACGQSVKTDNQGTTGATNPGTSATETKEPDLSGKYDPAIEITSIRSAADPSYKFDEGESLESNIWIKAYENDLGIKLKYNWMVSGDQYDQKFSVAVASGDLPDVFKVTKPADFSLLVENDMIADLTDSYEKYASPLTKEIISKDGGTALKTATFKGRLMGIPETGSMLDGIQMIWIRADWLKKLNLPEPKTMDELVKTAEAFVNQDPDDNGKADTFGIAIHKDAVNAAAGFADLIGFYNGYHAYVGSWIKDASGSLVYGSIQPEVKTALAKLNEMFKTKIVHSEFGVMDGTKVSEATTGGKVGISYGQMWNSLWPLNSCKDQDPKADWKPIPIVSADDKPALNCLGAAVGSYFVANKKCAHPEAAVKLVNEYVDKAYSPNCDIKNYIIGEDGKQIFAMAAFKLEPPTKNLDCYLAVVDAINTKDTSKLNDEAKGYYDKVIAYQGGDNTTWGHAAVFGPGGSQGICDLVNKTNAWVFNEFYGAPTASMTDKNATLKKIELETFTKIVMGTVHLDEFDKFVTQWKELGGDQIAKEVNEWYNAKN